MRSTQAVASARWSPLIVAGLFVVVCAAWFVVHPADASVSMDDGAYAIAVDALENGEWNVPYRAGRVDEAAAAFPYPNAEASEEGFFPYVRQPAWVAALRVADAAGNAVGMRLLVVLLGAGAIVSASMLARDAGHPDDAVLAAVLTALSPLAFNALQLWAHAGATFGVAVACLGAIRVMDQRSAGLSSALAIVSAAVAGSLRADGAIFALAVGLVVAFVGIRRRDQTVLFSGAGIGLAAVLSQVVTGIVVGRITGGRGAGRATASRAAGGLRDRIDAAVHTLISTEGSSRLAYVLLLAAVILTVYAVVLVRRRELVASSVALMIATVLWMGRLLTAHEDLATGLVGAWPLAVLVAMIPWTARSTCDRRILAIVMLGTGGVLLSQYDAGGGANWGGRFVSPALPLLAVLIASGVGQVVRNQQRHGAWVMASALFLAVVTTAASLAADSTHRSNSDQVVSRIEQADPDGWVVTSQFSLPNLAWRTYGDIRWLRVPSAESGGADRMHHILEDLDVDRFTAYRLEDDAFSTLTGSPPSENEPNVPTTVSLAR